RCVPRRGYDTAQGRALRRLGKNLHALLHGHGFRRTFRIGSRDGLCPSRSGIARPVLRYGSQLRRDGGHAMNDAMQRTLRVFRLARLTVATLAGARPAGAVVIDFENLNAPGNGTGGLTVANQYAAQGITFNFVTALDYSQGTPILTGFAHSGTK